ncbi:hypothetical protein Tco_0436029 [Tanacetum coccineum]
MSFVVVSNMLNPSPNTGIDSIFNLNTESTSLVDVPVSMTVEMPPSATTIPPPPFKDRVKSLEDDFSEFKQTNQFAVAVSLILDIVDTYLANKMNEAIKIVVQLQSERLRDEAQAKNADFINKLDDNIKKILKEQVKAQVKEQVTKILPRIEKTINEQLEAEILTYKMESNKSIHRSDHQKTLYKALGSKRRRVGKEPESTSAPKEKTSKSSSKSKEGSKSHNTSTSKSAHAEEPIHTDKDLEEPTRQEFDTGFIEDQPVDETTQHHDWF